MFGPCVHGPAFEASPIQICAYVRFAGAIGSLTRNFIAAGPICPTGVPARIRFPHPLRPFAS